MQDIGVMAQGGMLGYSGAKNNNNGRQETSAGMQSSSNGNAGVVRQVTSENIQSSNNKQGSNQGNLSSNTVQGTNLGTNNGFIGYGTDNNTQDLSVTITQPRSNLISTNVVATTVVNQAPTTKIFATKYVTKWNFQLRPSGRVDKFCIATILDKMIISIVKVDPTAYLKSWNTENAAPIYSTATIPKTDDDMNMYIENPYTTSAEKFGRLYGRITMVSSIPAVEIKHNQDFGVWIREKGLFLDRSELQTTKPKYIGIFDKNFATEAKIPWFTAYLANSITLSRPYQITSHPIYANDGTGLKTFAYQMWAATVDEETLLQEMQAFHNPSFKFLVYDAYIKSDSVEKRKVVRKLIRAAKQQASYVFQGITFDGYM